jgi:uncharacterized iron-regulated protein
MKIKSITLLALLILTNLLYSADLPAYKIFTEKGKSVDYKTLLKNTEDKKFIFFGEYHNNPIAHWLQFEITKDLHATHKRNLMLGAEMFEADNQFIIDEYLNDLISSANYQDEVRLWPNYNTDYKPLIEYAKEHKIPFIATNIPRRYANMVYKKGITSLNELSELAKSYIVPLNQFTFDSTVTCYKNLMFDMDGHGGINMAHAQAIKDATMAYFILKNITSKSVFLHYNGAYHSDNREGIVHYLLKTIAPEKIMTISTVEQKEVDALLDENKGLADYIICIPENMTKTH